VGLLFVGAPVGHRCVRGRARQLDSSIANRGGEHDVGADSTVV